MSDVTRNESAPPAGDSVLLELSHVHKQMRTGMIRALVCQNSMLQQQLAQAAQQNSRLLDQLVEQTEIIEELQEKLEKLPYLLKSSCSLIGTADHVAAQEKQAFQTALGHEKSLRSPKGE